MKPLCILSVILFGLFVFSVGCTKNQAKPESQVKPPVIIASHPQPAEPVPATVSRNWGALVVENGDTLWALSGKLYGEPWLWPLLCDLNSIPDCHELEIGQIVKFISKDHSLYQNAHLLQSLRQRAFECPPFHRRKS